MTRMDTNSIVQRLQIVARISTTSSLALVAGAAYAGSFSDVLEGSKDGGKASLDARARYEYNETGNADVNGYSLRTRLGYTTGEYEGWKAMVEMEDISFNDPMDRPALDVPTTELNQAWVSYQAYKLGRQIYVLDDHRFIGHVGWRQNIQTYDALTTSFLPSGESKISIGYLDAVHRVNATSQDLAGLIANGSYKFGEQFELTGFSYLLDFDLPILASSDTFGVRGAGNFSRNSLEYRYSFSAAKQVDNGGSTRDFDLNFFAGEFGASVGGVTLLGGFEFFEGDGATGFTTPLATLHKFNGFADMFAGNSAGLGGGLPQGLEDYYAMIGFSVGPVPIELYYHSFETENVSDFLGSEIDAVASYKVNEYITLVSKYAKYKTDGAEMVGYGGADKTVFTFEANLKY